MEANDYCKAREVLTHVHEFLSNLCRDARCDAHCSECIGASDLADDVYDLLHAPRRNCDVGTAEEQREKFLKFCAMQDCSVKCPMRKSKDMNECILKWAQMPYEEGGAK